ncbi:MAG: D-alanyl-D-alanine carboxypeptidase [Saprospiraceae bacterium]|nr:D-alanyl-D-alanine carboxypeptidase [Saprospiraceae bacterium]
MSLQTKPKFTSDLVRKPSNFLWCLVSLIMLISCRVKKPVAEVSKSEKPFDTTEMVMEPFCDYCHSGWLIMDASSGEIISSCNAEKYFIPASTAKVLALFAALKTAEERMPAIEYFENDTMLVFRGLGDPTLLHPDFDIHPCIGFLQNRKHKRIYLDCQGFEHPRYGKGWMWDDYLDAYQAEISPLPVYGNVVEFRQDSTKMHIIPEYFRGFTTYQDIKRSHRAWDRNCFVAAENRNDGYTSHEYLPFIQECVLTARLLSDTLGMDITAVTDMLSQFTDKKVLYGSFTDTIIRRVMYQSDNLFAEQFYFGLSYGRSGDTGVQSGIQYVLQQYLTENYKPMKWVDGSGLSRYNLMSPSNLVYLLYQLYTQNSEEKLFPFISPAGKNYTASKNILSDKNIIIAKSGSMSGVYNLCGYIITPAGKKRIFAIMNNNFLQPVSEVRKKVWNFLMNFSENSIKADRE